MYFFRHQLHSQDSQTHSLCFFQERIVTHETINTWFRTVYLAARVKKPYHPSLVLNLDETMLDFATSHKCFAIVPRGFKRGLSLKLELGKHVSLLFGIAADGFCVKPQVILPLKSVPLLSEFTMSTFCFAPSDNGWMDETIYRSYIQHQFIPHVEQVRCRNAAKGIPFEDALLILDGHYSHYGAEVLKRPT